MKPVQRILVGIDLSPECLDVWREACAVARTFSAELELLHAIEGVQPGSADLEAASARVKGRIDDLRRAGTAEGTRIGARCHLRAGDPADALLGAARDLEVDLIIVGAGTRTRQGGILLGSAAEQVVLEAVAPVWVVRPGRAHARFERILVALDPTNPRRELVHAAGLVARASGARITLLSIVSDTMVHEQVRGSIQEAIGGTAAEALDVEVYVRSAARPSVELIDAAQREATDLLIVGEPARCAGPGEVHDLREHATVDKILRLVPCSLLRVRQAPRAGAAPASGAGRWATRGSAR